MNAFISLADSIEHDLSMRPTEVRATERKETYSSIFVLPNVSMLIPKGKFTVAFCETCLYLESSVKQIKIDYSNVFSVISIGSLDVKTVTNVVLALKMPLAVGKRKLSSLCLSLDNQKVFKVLFEDKKRQVSGKQYSIFLTVLKLKHPFTLVKPEPTFFVSSQRLAFIRCYQGTNPCWLVPCRPGLIVLTSSSVHYIPNEEITALNLDRLGGGTFDFTIKAGKNVFDLTMVAREERGCLEEYSKEIIKENRRRQNGREEEEEEDSSEEEFSEEEEDEEEKAEDARAVRELVKEGSEDALSSVEEESEESEEEGRRKRVC
ncbi:hypothetical protein WA588_000925, partial [Blastocystis sp. NMH]